jgi:hypothetical protein
VSLKNNSDWKIATSLPSMLPLVIMVWWLLL